MPGQAGPRGRAAPGTQPPGGAAHRATLPGIHARGGNRMPSTPPQYAWKDGKVIPWDECVLHGRTQSAFFGANVFEGIRAYWTDKDQELYLFRNREHQERLARSMKTVRMQVPFSLD